MPVTLNSKISNISFIRFLLIFTFLSVSACAHMGPHSEIKLPSDQFSSDYTAYLQPSETFCKLPSTERVEIIWKRPDNGRRFFVGFVCLKDPKPVRQPTMDNRNPSDLPPGIHPGRTY